MFYLGQFSLGQVFLTPGSTLANFCSGQFYSGQVLLRPIFFFMCVRCVCVVLCVVCVVCGLCCVFCACVCPPEPTPPPSDPPIRRTAQNFAFFFLPASSFFSLWGSSRWILVVFFEGRDPRMCTFGLSTPPFFWLCAPAHLGPHPSGPPLLWVATPLSVFPSHWLAAEEGRKPLLSSAAKSHAKGGAQPSFRPSDCLQETTTF